jgi:DNA-binding NtrC family response regulator
LNVVPIYVPPLRDRRSDILLLAETFMRRYAKKHGCPICGFSKSSLEVMQEHSWPGNIRELQNVVERAVILTPEGGYIEPGLLGLTQMSSGQILIPTAHSQQFPEPDSSNIFTPDDAPTHPPAGQAGSVLGKEEILPLSELEKNHILASLDAFDQNRTKTAKHLGISIRTLRNKLNEYQKSDQNSSPIEDSP